MAAPDTANLRSNTWKVTLTATEAPFNAAVTVSGGYDVADVRSQKTGTDIIAKLVQGRTFDLAFEFEEDTAFIQQLGLGLPAAGDMLDVGALLPTQPVKLHPASLADATETHDIYLYAVAFGKLERTTNGQGVAIWKLTAQATRDANGKVGRQGPAA